MRPSHTLLRIGGFTLLEVVAAVAIFAVGMVSIVALYAPITNSVATVGDAETAARVADAVRARLNALPFDTALALVQDSATVRTKDGLGNYNPNDGTKNPEVLFARLNSEVGIYDPATNRKRWYDSRGAAMSDADKFFEVDLIRNDAVTPKSADPTAAYVAFIIRVRWPAFVLTSPNTAVQSAENLAGGSVTFDHGRKHALFFPGTISR